LKNLSILLNLFWFLAIFPSPPLLQAGNNLESKLIKIKDSDGQEIELYKKSYALVIGVSNYTNGWPKLLGVKKDIQQLIPVLKEHGFHIVLVEDPTHDQLVDAFNDFINLYGLELDNRLLFYYAGHGHTLRQSYGEEMGYIVPADTPKPKQLSGFLAKAIDMRQIEVFAKQIQSKHALMLFDSCFSGSIFSLSRSVPTNISYKTSKPVRQFITSGSADEEVPDKSIFLQQLLTALKGKGDLNNDGYVTGTELSVFLQDNVINYTRGAQHPQYGKIRHPNLDKGDFVFMTDKERRFDEELEEEKQNIELWNERLKKKGKKDKGKPNVPLPSF
jgi:uncharacterized caspase-like protein